MADESVADRLRELGVKGVLVQMAERGQILELKCEMPQCYHPNARDKFESLATERRMWAPSRDHYPILRSVIADVMGPAVTLVDSGEAVSGEVATLLAERDLLRDSDDPPEMQFYVTDAAARFRNVAERFLDAPLERFETVELSGSPL